MKTIIGNILKIMEICIAVLLVSVLVFYFVRTGMAAWAVIWDLDSTMGLEHIQSLAFSLVIGVEFVKMLCRPTTGTVVEVLMFVIARYLIIDHSSGIGCLFGVAAVAILFIIKKYLISDFDDK